MHKRNRSATLNIKQILVDILTLAIAYLIATILYAVIKGTFLGKQHVWMFFIGTIVFILAMNQCRMYNITTFQYYDRIARRTLFSVLIAGLCLSMAVFLLKLDKSSRLIFVLFISLSYVLVVLMRFVFRISGRWEKVRECKIVLFIGNDDVFEHFKHFVKQTAIKYRFIGVLNETDETVRSIESFEKYITQNNINEVIIVYQPASDMNYQDYLSVCDDMGITVQLVMDMYDLPGPKHFVTSIGTYPVITYHSISLNQYQLFIKSLIDFLGALFGLVVLSPLFLITALAIKIETPGGPVFFRQERAGKNGKVFTIYKFRSMYADAEQRKAELMAQNKIKDNLMFKLDNDPRVTRVGAFIRKWSIDELPQLINVLLGDMSLVGTRPPTVDEVKDYKRTHRYRISIKPGITGMWQANGRSNITDFEQVVALDKMYIEQWSILLDLKLIIKTILVVLQRDGAY